MRRGALDADVDRIAAAAADERERTVIDKLFMHQIGLDDQDVRAGGVDPSGEFLAIEVDFLARTPVLVHHVHMAAEPGEAVRVERCGDECFHETLALRSRVCTVS